MVANILSKSDLKILYFIQLQNIDTVTNLQRFYGLSKDAQ